MLPVLSKAGCNGGGCHGALAGKGGFRLGLNAYDPATDHYNITRENRGRRIEFAAPASSLLSQADRSRPAQGRQSVHENSGRTGSQRAGFSRVRPGQATATPRSSASKCPPPFPS